MTAKDPRAAKIAALNDAFRQNRGGSGRQVMTAGVSAEGPEFVTKALAAIATFDAFTADKDPYGEHDFGSVTIDGQTVFFEIDYYQSGSGYTVGAQAPDNPTTTDRLLTIMLAEEYEDVARLSPLGHEPINMLGRYTFMLPDQVAESDATRTVIPIHCGHHSDDRGQLVMSG